MNVTFWLISFLLGIGVWFYLNISDGVDYERNPALTNPITGHRRQPSDLANLSRIILRSEEYINSTNAQERLYDLEYTSNSQASFLIDHSYSRQQDLILSGYPVANGTLCGEQLHWLLNQLNANRNYTSLRGQLGYELTSLLDSFGRPESGLYSGAINWLGSYKQCINLALDGGNIKTRYCIGRMAPKWWPANETVYPKTTVRLGLCLPESCDTLSFDTHNSTIETLAKFELPQIYKDGLDMVSMFCLPDERSPMREITLAGYIYLFALGAWCLLVLCATIAHECSSSNIWIEGRKMDANTDECVTTDKRPTSCPMESITGAKIVAALSLRCALKTFTANAFRVKYEQGQKARLDLSGLNCIRVLMTIGVVFGHSGYFSIIYSRSLSNRIDLGIGLFAKMLMTTQHFIDTFFFIFGTLASYNMVRRYKKNQMVHLPVWLAYIKSTAVKTVPSYMLVYGYSRLISALMGSGPWWDYGVDEYSMKGACMSEPWWKSVPYIGNLGTPPVSMCIPPGWFIYTYLQASLLLPLITYIICKLSSYFKKSLFVNFILLASALSLGLRLYGLTSVSVKWFTIAGMLMFDLIEKYEQSGYLSTLGRLGCISAGCFFGYLLRKYEEGEIERWPHWIQKKRTLHAASALILLFMLLPLIGHYLYLFTGRVGTREEVVAVNVIMIILWPILNAVVILHISTISNHTLPARFLGHSFWCAFNNLGSGIYLIHWEVLFVAMTMFEQAPAFGFQADIIKLWAFGLFVSIPVAFIIHLLVEVPIVKLYRLSEQRPPKRMHPSKGQTNPEQILLN